MDVTTLNQNEITQVNGGGNPVNVDGGSVNLQDGQIDAVNKAVVSDGGDYEEVEKLYREWFNRIGWFFTGVIVTVFVVPKVFRYVVEKGVARANSNYKEWALKNSKKK